MAEQVQALMERMVTPLRDLRDRGIFTEVSVWMFDVWNLTVYI
jgi:hypothetical protein